MRKLWCLLFGHNLKNTGAPLFFSVKMKALGQPPQEHFRCLRCEECFLVPVAKS